MKKKILVFAAFLSFFSTSYASSNSDLPALPSPEETVVSTSEKEQSLWDKILTFFNFGKEAKTEEIKKTGGAVLSSPVMPEQERSSIRQTATSKTPETNNPIQAQSVTVSVDKTEDSSNQQTKVTAANTSANNENKADYKKPVENSKLDVPKGLEPEKVEITPKEVKKLETESIEKPNDQKPVESLKLPEGFAEDVETNKQPLPAEADKARGLETANSLPAPQEISNNKPQQFATPQLEPQKEMPLPTASAQKETKAPSQAESAEVKEQNVSSPLSDEIIKKQTQPDKNSEVFKYRQQLQKRLNQPQELPQIPKEEVSKISSTKTNNTETDVQQQKFINDEAQVLTLPNDDIVLGEITKEALLDLVDFSTYVTLFWHNYYMIKSEPARQAIDDFIKNYDNRTPLPTKEEITEAFQDALSAINRNSIYELINLVENYPILQITDSNGNSLLQTAVNAENYSAVKFLLMRGVNLSTINNEGDTAMDIALDKNNKNIINLLKSAGAK